MSSIKREDDVCCAWLFEVEKRIALWRDEIAGNFTMAEHQAKKLSYN